MHLRFPLQSYPQVWYAYNNRCTMAVFHTVLSTFGFLPVKTILDFKIHKISIVLRCMDNNHFLTITESFSSQERKLCPLCRVGHGKWVPRLSYLWLPDIYNSFSDKFICSIQYTLISYQSHEHLREEKRTH